MNLMRELFSLWFAPMAHGRPAVAGHSGARFETYPGITGTAPSARPAAARKPNRLAILVDELFGNPEETAQAPAPMADEERRAVALLACGFIRGGYYDDAEALLRLSIERSTQYAPFLNLMGAVCEAREDWRMARRYYGQAIAADRSSADAQQNMRRIFELFTFGASREPIALGDEVADGRTPVLQRFPRHAENQPAITAAS